MDELSFLLMIGLIIVVWRQGRRLARLERALSGRGQAEALPAEEAAPPAWTATAEPPPIPPLADEATTPQTEDIAPEPAAQNAGGFEERLTQRWFVWLGGIILAFGALFLVRAAADAGLFGPRLRLAAAGLGGLGAILLAEWLVRRTDAERLNDRVPAALAAAGSAALFASVWAAHALYGFLAASSAFLLMAAIALLTLAMALRHGQFLAWLGLGGGLAAPLLAGDPTSGMLPLLLYLGVVFAAAFGLLRFRPWRAFLWMLLPAVVLFPVLLLIDPWLGMGRATTDYGAIAGFLLWLTAVGLLLPSDGPTRRVWRVVLQIVLACLWLVLTATGDYGGTLLILFLLATAVAMASIRYRRFDGAAALVMPVAGLLLLSSLDIGPLDWQSFGQSTTAPDLWNAAQASLQPRDIGLFVRMGGALAGVMAGMGLIALWGARRPGLWACIAVFGPLLVVATSYLRLGWIEGMPRWLTLMALALALAATLLCGFFRRYGRALRGPVAATALGALAGLALAAAIMLTQAWLPLALTALALAAVLLWCRLAVRSLLLAAPWLGWSAAFVALLDPATAGLGSLELPNLLAGTCLPAVLLWLAAGRIRQPARLRRVASRVQLAGLVFAILAVGHGSRWLAAGTASPELVEAGLRAAAWFATLAWLVAYGRDGRLFYPAALAHAALLALVAAPPLLFTHNPVLVPVPVGDWPVFNLLLPGYGLPAAAILLLALAARRAATTHPGWRIPAALTGIAALIAMLAYPALEIRHGFHGSLMTGRVLDAELYAYSLWLLIAAAILLTAGIARDHLALRRAGIAVLALALGKLFLLDFAHLDGILRALSFLGLGLGLIAVGYAFRRWAAPSQAGL